MKNESKVVLGFWVVLLLAYPSLSEVSPQANRDKLDQELASCPAWTLMGPTPIVVGECANVCNCSVSCSTLCVGDYGSPIGTCDNWGWCDGGQFCPGTPEPPACGADNFCNAAACACNEDPDCSYDCNCEDNLCNLNACPAWDPDCSCPSTCTTNQDCPGTSSTCSLGSCICP